jgi:hypothetical protein
MQMIAVTIVHYFSFQQELAQHRQQEMLLTPSKCSLTNSGQVSVTTRMQLIAVTVLHYWQQGPPLRRQQKVLLTLSKCRLLNPLRGPAARRQTCGAEPIVLTSSRQFSLGNFGGVSLGILLVVMM